MEPKAHYMWSLEMCLQDAVDAINRMKRVADAAGSHNEQMLPP